MSFSFSSIAGSLLIVYSLLQPKPAKNLKMFQMLVYFETALDQRMLSVLSWPGGERGHAEPIRLVSRLVFVVERASRLWQLLTSVFCGVVCSCPNFRAEHTRIAPIFSVRDIRNSWTKEWWHCHVVILRCPKVLTETRYNSSTLCSWRSRLCSENVMHSSIFRILAWIVARGSQRTRRMSMQVISFFFFFFL